MRTLGGTSSPGRRVAKRAGEVEEPGPERAELPPVPGHEGDQQVGHPVAVRVRDLDPGGVDLVRAEVGLHERQADPEGRGDRPAGRRSALRPSHGPRHDLALLHRQELPRPVPVEVRGGEVRDVGVAADRVPGVGHPAARRRRGRASGRPAASRPATCIAAVPSPSGNQISSRPSPSRSPTPSQKTSVRPGLREKSVGHPGAVRGRLLRPVREEVVDPVPGEEPEPDPPVRREPPHGDRAGRGERALVDRDPGDGRRRVEGPRHGRLGRREHHDLRAAGPSFARARERRSTRSVRPSRSTSAVRMPWTFPPGSKRYRPTSAARAPPGAAASAAASASGKTRRRTRTRAGRRMRAWYGRRRLGRSAPRPGAGGWDGALRAESR